MAKKSQLQENPAEESSASNSDTKSLENALSATEEMAKLCLGILGRGHKTVKLIREAAALGELTELSRTKAKLAELSKDLIKAMDDIHAIWPWSTDSEEEEWLASNFMQELAAEGNANSVPMHRYGKNYSAFPAIMAFDAGSRTLRIDRKRIKSIRPSILVSEIIKARSAKPRFRPDQFIEFLYSGYTCAVGVQVLKSGQMNHEAVVRLAEVYALLTQLPGSSSDYPQSDFLRDLHQLDLSGIRTTQNGNFLHLSAATSTKSGSDVLTVVDDVGRTFSYFAIAFRQQPE